MDIRVFAQKDGLIIWNKLYSSRAEAREVTDRLIEQGHADYVSATYSLYQEMAECSST
jgi:hypothetical protein